MRRRTIPNTGLRAVAEAAHDLPMEVRMIRAHHWDCSAYSLLNNLPRSRTHVIV